MGPEKKFVLFFLISFLFLKVDGQIAINLKVESGYNFGFSSYSPNRKVAFIALSRPWAKEFYSLTKRVDLAYAPNIGIGLEALFGSRHKLQIGMTFSEKTDIVFVNQYVVPYHTNGDTSYYMQVSQTYHSLLAFFYNKAHALYSYNILPGKVDANNWSCDVSLLFGVNLLFNSIKYQDYEMVYNSTIFHESIDKWGNRDTLLSINLKGYAENTRNLYSLMGGVDFCIKRKNRSLANIRIYYEHGLKLIQSFLFTYKTSEKVFQEELYSFGSGLYFKISVPIRLFTTKH